MENKEHKLKPKDAQAKKRCDDERELRIAISDLLQEFSKKYDVECVNIEISRNEFYGKYNYNCHMYLLNLAWSFDYLAHPE